MPAAFLRSRPRLLLLALTALLLSEVLALAQSARSGRNRAGNRRFPTWEQDVDSSIPPPLPQAASGRLELVGAADLGGRPTGIARLPDGTGIVALTDGRVLHVDRDLSLLATWSLEQEGAGWPVAGGAAVIVAAGRTLAAFTSDGVRWTRALDAPAVLAPKVLPDGVALTLEGGLVELRRENDGALAWSARLEGEPVAGPSALPGGLAWGTSEGEVVALRLEEGRPWWRREVAERVDTLTATRDSVYFTGHGRTNRRLRGTGPILGRLALSASGEPRKIAWRKRVGGGSNLAPVSLGELVLFATHDNYLRALEGRDGHGGWRTDIPARVHHPPVRVGGRLDFVLPLTGLVVSIAADNGAVMGWTRLVDPDETFVGPAIPSADLVLATTSLGRLLSFRWQYDDAS